MFREGAEKYRPVHHITPKKGFLNDPNGLVYFNGGYHVFYQLYPHGIEGGIEKHWAHLVSTDLINWRELPVALSPDEYGSIWSGSCIVDEKNASGLFDSVPGKQGLIAYYTSTGMNDVSLQRQCMAYSGDGITWTKYNNGAPIIDKAADPAKDNDFRDPKVFWYEAGKRWLMVTAGGPLRIFSSVNLIDWKVESFNTDLRTECPDMFCLPCDGGQKWILSGCSDWYMPGDLVQETGGIKFVPDTGMKLSLNFGPDRYAAQTFSNTPGRTIKIDWVSSSFNCREYAALHKNEWIGALSLPCQLSLKKTDEGLRLVQTPVPELEALHGSKTEIQIEDQKIDSSVKDLSCKPMAAFEIKAEIDVGTSSTAGIRLHSNGRSFTSLAYDTGSKKLVLDRTKSFAALAPHYNKAFSSQEFELQGNSLKLHIFVDGPVIEVFAQDGLHVATALSYFQADDQTKIELFAEGGSAVVKKLVVYELKAGE